MNFYNLTIVQIAICIIISWALFAIFVSFVQEAVAQVLAERGRFMKNYLLKQLHDTPNDVNWGTLIYLNGAIQMLIRESNKPTNDIHPKLFARVLIETFGQSELVQSKKRPTGYKNELLDNFKSGVSTLQDSPFVSFLELSLTNAEIKQTTEIKKEHEIYEDLVLQLENWFTEMVERLNLWYKKRMRRKLFIFGLLLAILINVDSIQLFSFYKMNPDSRAAVMNYYEDYIVKIPDNSRPADARVSIQNLDSLVKTAELPVGFDHNLFVDVPAKGMLFWKIAGLCLSGFAAAFGAPFWFDVLKKAYTKKP